MVALDTPDADGAAALARRLRGRVGGFKIGLELFNSGGAALVPRIRDAGDAVFLDLKLHDIPNTVAGAAAAIARRGVSYFTVHALGGAAMIRRGVEAAGEAARAAGLEPPLLLAVTVLTSHDDDELSHIGLAGPCASAVLRLAALARDAGAGGVVCSALEVAAVRDTFPRGTLVVPGIRPAQGAVGAVGSDDQARTAGPAAAVARGADLLVIGRPITRAPDPVAAAEAIVDELERAD
jgi:orotidine-5'-phosphate decarboxylase